MERESLERLFKRDSKLVGGSLYCFGQEWRLAGYFIFPDKNKYTPWLNSPCYSRVIFLEFPLEISQSQFCSSFISQMLEETMREL